MTRLSEQSDVISCSGEAFAGEYEPVTVSLVPLRNLGKVAVSVVGPDRPGRHDPRVVDRPGLRLEPPQPRQRGRVRLHDSAPV